MTGRNQVIRNPKSNQNLNQIELPGLYKNKLKVNEEIRFIYSRTETRLGHNRTDITS